MSAARKLAKDVYIVAAKRTPFGTYGGVLKDMSPTQLGVVAAEAALTQANLSPEAVDSVVVGNVAQTAADTSYLARHVGLKAGVPIDRPALTINRLCGSGFQSIVNGTQEILCGDAEIVLTGGAESMSSAPFSARSMRFGTKLFTDVPLKETIGESLFDMHAGCPMAITAENLAEKYDISKEECDEFAVRSQQLWKEANEAGRFDDEMAPITYKHKKEEKVMSTDEHPRPNANIEQMSKLPAVFKKGGVVSAANASGINDGAGAVIVASGEAVEKHGLKPLAKVVSYGVAGVEPTIMGIGPVPAIKMALERANLGLDDMDRIEINEAFAGQVLACVKELDIDMNKFNLNGGAIAIGHPTGASGSRIMANLTHELQRTGGQYAIGSACIGGGQGIAIVIERCD